MPAHIGERREEDVFASLDEFAYFYVSGGQVEYVHTKYRERDVDNNGKTAAPVANYSSTIPWSLSSLRLALRETMPIKSAGVGSPPETFGATAC